MKKLLAYVFAIIGWLIGVIIGVVWALLYGGYRETNIIDLPTLLMENILPAIVSVYLSNHFFQNFFPKNDTTFEFHKKVVNILLIINYSFILYESLIYSNYSNIIYVITGLIYSGYNIVNNKRIED